MSTSYPTSLDTFVNPAGTDNLATVNHASQHGNINDAVAALEAKVGVNGSAVTTSLDYKVARAAPAAFPQFLRAANQAMTLDPTTITQPNGSLTSQTLFLTFFTSAASFTTTQVRYVVVTPATTSSAGTSIGLYSVDASDNGTLIASVSSTTLFTTGGAITASWAASVALTGGSRYAVGFLNVVNSGTPNLCAAISPTTNMTTEWGVAPRLTGSRAGQSAQGNFTVGQLSAQGLAFYAVIL